MDDQTQTPQDQSADQTQIDLPDQTITPESPPKPAGFDAMPTSNQVNVTGQAPQLFDLQGPTTPQETKQYLAKQTQDWAQDLENQHITPKTYGQLFNDDKTPGKIASIFGLMVGGMSQGLIGGENPYLKMMDNVIKNDLVAQQQSKANAQNFLRLNQQHQLEEYSKKLQGANTDYTKKQADNLGFGLTMKQMNVSKLHIAVQQMEQLKTAAAADPTNQQKQVAAQNAQQAVGMIAAQMGPENASIDDLVAARTGIINAAHPEDSQKSMQVNPQGVDMGQLQNIIQTGKIAPNMPGFVAPEEAGQLKTEAGKVLQNREVLKNYKDTFRDLANNKIKNINQPDYDALTDLVAKQWAAQLGMGEQASKELKTNIFPSLVKDWGPTAEDKFKQGQKHFQFLESNTPEIQAFAKSNPGLYSPIQIESINPNQKAGAPIQNGPTEGATGKTSDGRAVIFKNGKWVPK